VKITAIKGFPVWVGFRNQFVAKNVSNVGGLTEARKIAGWCEAHDIDIKPHNPLGPICTAASVHLGAATNNFTQLEYRHEVEAARYQFAYWEAPHFHRRDGAYTNW
jgi:galactonate dehydratase